MFPATRAPNVPYLETGLGPGLFVSIFLWYPDAQGPTKLTLAAEGLLQGSGVHDTFSLGNNSQPLANPSSPSQSCLTQILWPT